MIDRDCKTNPIAATQKGEETTGMSPKAKPLLG
jgi:hypothetical protein